MRASLSYSITLPPSLKGRGLIPKILMEEFNTVSSTLAARYQEGQGTYVSFSVEAGLVVGRYVFPRVRVPGL